jgi:hypothetical protein
MSQTLCAGCQAPLLPHVDLCFDCDLGAPRGVVVARTLRRVRITGPVADPVALSSALAHLAGAAGHEDADAIVGEPSFDVVGSFSADQEARLARMLESCGAAHEVLAPSVPPPVGRRGAWDRHDKLKLLVVLIVGAGGWALAAPLVPLLAGGMIALIMVRALREAPCEIEVRERRGAESLHAVSIRVLEAVGAARRSTSDPRRLESLRHVVTRVAELSAALRDAGRHLLSPERRALDEALVETALAFAAVVRTADPEAAPSQTERTSTGPYRRGSRPWDEASRSLAECVEALVPVRQLAADSPAEAARVVARIGEEARKRLGGERSQ